MPEGWYGVVELPLERSAGNSRPNRKVYVALEGYPEHDTNAWNETGFRACWVGVAGEHLDELTTDDLNEELIGIIELAGLPHPPRTFIYVSDYLAEMVAHTGSYEYNYDYD